jgi:ribulose-5-phosphate 4-epimerase/fuculose-1-phosphate aldolase
MENVSDHVLDEFLEACHNAADRDLMRCSCGNLSRRLDPTRFLATSSGTWMENISREEVSVCRIADGSLLQGPEPTAEVGFHAGILKTRSDVDVVIHFQTPCATALACRRADDINFFVIPEIPFYIGDIARVPYFPPGSKALAQVVIDAMQDHDMVIMRNHGMVTVAADYMHAIQNSEFFELACEIISRGGDKVEPISEEDVQYLLRLRQNKGKEGIVKTEQRL